MEQMELMYSGNNDVIAKKLGWRSWVILPIEESSVRSLITVSKIEFRDYLRENGVTKYRRTKLECEKRADGYYFYQDGENYVVYSCSPEGASIKSTFENFDSVVLEFSELLWRGC